MTELANRKVEVKKNIRSVLLSAPLGLTMRELERDYDLFMGHKLPSRELGYSSTEELLLDIPDAVKITRNNGILLLTGVPDASTQNIQKLVSRQKVDTNKKWDALRCMPSSRQRGGRRDPAHYFNPRRSNSTSVQMFDRGGFFSSPIRQHREFPHRHARHRYVPCVTAFVRGLIHELLRNHPDGFPLTHFGTVFQKHYGIPLDYSNMGFSSVQDMFASLADIVTLKQLSVGESRVMSVEAARALQEGHNFPRQHHNEYEIDNRTALEEANQRHTTPLTRPPFKEAKELMIQDRSLPCNGESELDLYMSCTIPLAVQDNIRKIMENRPRGIYASRLPFEYKNTFQKELPHKYYGYNSVIEFATDLPHIIRIEKPHPQGDWHLLPANAKPSAGNDSSEIVAKKQGNDNLVLNIEVEQSVKETMSQVLSVQPDGIPLKDFEGVYKKMTGQDLKFDRYGASCLRQFLHSMPELLVISLNSSDIPMVCLKAAGKPRRFDKLLPQYHPTTVHENQTHEPIVLPLDAVSPGCFYTSQPLPDFGDTDHYIQLYVSFVLNPAIFWIQLRGPKTTLALEDLMDEMEAVYHSKHLSPDYDMKASLAKRGMICAVIFPEDGHWHRGIITGFENQLYEVYYVDYGNVCYVSISQMRLLKTKFMKLPVQAIRARLSNIKPADESSRKDTVVPQKIINAALWLRSQVWSTSSKSRLLALCREKPLFGLVTNIKDGVLSLCLIDTTPANDVYINDVMVEEGYAVFAPDTETVKIMEHSLAPSAKLLYGENKAASSQDNTPAMPVCRRYIRQAKMTNDLIMNLINLDGHLYLLSSEISQLFFDEDILNAELCRKNIEVVKVVVSRKEYPDLFNELAVYGAPNFTEATNVLTLVSFSSLPMMIHLFEGKCDFEDLKDTALEILQWFDPDDPYWKGEDVNENTDEDTHSSSDDQSDMPGLEDLENVLYSLEIKKKRMLHQMVSVNRFTPQNVDELSEVELNVKRVEALIAKLKTLSCASESIPSPASSLQVKTEPGLTPDATTQRQLPAMLTQLKSTQKVAPMIQTVHPKEETVASSLEASAQSAVNMNNLFQQQLLITKMMMEQLGTSQKANTLQTPYEQMLLQSFGQGMNIQQQFMQPSLLHMQTGVSATPATQSLPNSVFSLEQGSVMPHTEQSLQDIQLLQQFRFLNPRLAALGLSSPLATSQLADMGSSTHPTLSGYQSMLGGLRDSSQGSIYNCYGASGPTANVSLPKNYSLALPSTSLSSSLDSASSAGNASQSLASSSFMQSQLFQQAPHGVEEQSEIMSRLQMLMLEKAANKSNNPTPGAGV